MPQPDEPLFDMDAPATPVDEDPPLTDRIDRLVRGQPYGVLCTQGEGQPYGSLVAFAFTDDLRHAVFATPTATRKYRLLTQCDHVALVIDNRPDRSGELMEIEALTVTGRAREIARDGDHDRWADLLVRRHPYLESFVAASSCALFRIDVIRCFHVHRFQEVHQWVPAGPS
jgi:nitroimidazol reductase NimA-like FMN-containing flavoprotein (pyridoxamine 5'-phosphate oxidase superfamily)